VNDTIVAAAGRLSDAGVSVLHAVGRKNADQRPSPAPNGFITVDYVDRMDLAYAAADLALCRAGAMTVAELAAVGLPAVYVPLPVGNGEQRRNAAGVIDAGGGVAVADEDLDVTTLLDTVVPLITDPDTIDTMSRAAAAQGTRGSTEKLVRMTLHAAAGG
jgi:UDP-N-acetylglucosamine--N-acetylmuramyl-(pentapeptide) pyrophosphoryl-undecaprenol N-acetylglucosamine transferase